MINYVEVGNLVDDEDNPVYNQVVTKEQLKNIITDDLEHFFNLACEYIEYIDHFNKLRHEAITYSPKLISDLMVSII